MDSNCEHWKDIRDLEGYQVSDLGNVRKVRDDGTFEILVPSMPDYLVVKIDGKRCPIHRLVAETFIDQEPDKPYVDHINGNTHDNRACNLRWCTPKENATFPLARMHMSTALEKVRERRAKTNQYINDQVESRVRAILVSLGIDPDAPSIPENGIRLLDADLAGRRHHLTQKRDHMVPIPVMCVETGERFDCIRLAADAYGAKYNKLKTALYTGEAVKVKMELHFKPTETENNTTPPGVGARC